MAAATVLGIGLGGFIDGIVLHQILQWHEMLSNKIPATTYIGKSVNMFWDGIFHAFTLLVTITGVILLWKLLRRKDINRSGNLLAGGMLFGWGLFNLLEGIADHQLLKLHNVREITPDKQLWNLGFLGLSILFIVVGLLISKRRKGEDFESTHKST
ncbi:membrane protein [Segetibacter aerophilus]|uniref:Membrane protein n=2 Tax=Segetibacter aerophilus TaxID=670293 RepID=A0A512BHX6_9BACT|nr:membrane protein [Segetibacter aerophilus]